MTNSATAYCRATGIFLVLTIVAGWFGEMYVPSLIITGDVGSTAAQLRLNGDLFRWGFAAYLVEALSDIVLAWLFYVLLKPVNRELALLSAFFGLVSMSLFAVTEMFYFSAPLFAGGSKNLAAFSPAQLDALARLFLSLYTSLSGLCALFYGTAWIIRGWLSWRSAYLPQYLGALMVVAGLGFAAKSVTQVLAPQYSFDLLMAPMFLNAIAVALWMLIKGVHLDRWNSVTAVGHPPRE